MKSYHITVYIPCYNVAKTVVETLHSVLSQSYQNFDIVMRNNASTDNTYEVISKFKNDRIKIYQNKSYLPYSGNLQAGMPDCHGDIIFLMAGDDILSQNALFEYNQAFNLSPKIGAVTRPYFWFENNIDTPLRAKKQLDPNQHTVVKINDDFSKIKEVFSTLDQMSGLAFRRKFFRIPFGTEEWISHAYPFIDIFTRHPVVFLRDYTIAVRMSTSGTRKNIYQKSPMLFWVNMLNLTITQKKHLPIKKKLIRDFIAVNYIGLLQVKNFGEPKSLYREIYYLIRLNPINLFRPKFWAFILFVTLTPRRLSLFLTDWFKQHLYSKVLTKIIFPYASTG